MTRAVVIPVLATIALGISTSDAREWSDISGKHRFEADVVSTGPSFVRLRLKEDGAEYDIPLKMLSEADREFVGTVSTKRAQPLKTVPDAVARSIRENAVRKWPADYSMQRYEIDKQREGYIAVANFSDAAVPATVVSGIIRDAKAEWTGDYSMQEYEIEKQCEGYLAVKEYVAPDVPRHVFDGIIGNAKRKWSRDYSMQHYEIEKQVEAYRNLTE